MKAGLLRALEESLGHQRGSIVRATAIGGGCIHNASRLDLSQGPALFLKWASTGPVAATTDNVFAAESHGLTILARACDDIDGLETVSPIQIGRLGRLDVDYLVLPFIESVPASPRSLRQLGRGLALLHRSATQPMFGFDIDNFIGATPQPNGWFENWCDFFREQRLGYQLELAARSGLLPADLTSKGERLLAQLEARLGDPVEPPCLLHGDLWQGNVLYSVLQDDLHGHRHRAAGSPVLIDPACYYGRREADLAMTYLFGGFGPDFYAAYEEVWPTEPGADERRAIYQLYHLLNHLNLFGGGYLAGCRNIIEQLLKI